VTSSKQMVMFNNRERYLVDAPRHDEIVIRTFQIL